MLLVNQSRDSAYNMTRIESIHVVDDAIVVEMPSIGKAVVGRYRSDERAREVFEEVLYSLEGYDSNDLPFYEPAEPVTCYMPKE